MLNLIEASNKVLTDLDIAAQNARIFASGETRKEDRKNRRAGIWKSTAIRNRTLWNIYVVFAALIITLILILAKNN